MKNNMMIVITIQILTKIKIKIIIQIQIQIQIQIIKIQMQIQIQIQIIPTKIRTLILYPDLTKISNQILNRSLKQNNNKLKPIEKIVETYRVAPVEIIKEIQKKNNPE
jgi:hypothetical protein